MTVVEETVLPPNPFHHLDGFEEVRETLKQLNGEHLLYGYHNNRHMVNVAALASDFAGRAPILDDLDRNEIVMAALCHDLYHTGRPDTLMDDNGHSMNIELAVNAMCRVFERHPEREERPEKVAQLIRATQWPHKPIDESFDTQTKAKIGILRDADVLSSLLPFNADLLLGGLRNELGLDISPFLQFENHVAFMRDYVPATALGAEFARHAIEETVPVWAAFFAGRFPTMPPSAIAHMCKRAVEILDGSAPGSVPEPEE